MKVNSVVLAVLAMSPSLFAEESSQWEFSLGGDVGTYDNSDYNYAGWSGGIGYETDAGTHSLLIGIGEMDNSKSGSIMYPDFDSFSVAYRYSYPVTKRFDLFAEVGMERLSWSETISDPVGNPLSLGFDDTNYFLGLGAEVKLIECLYLTASVRYYLSDNEVFEASAIGLDNLANAITLYEEAPNFMAKVGVTFKF